MSEAKTSGGQALGPGEKLAGRFKILEALEGNRYKVQDEQNPNQAFVLAQFPLSSTQTDRDKVKRALERATRAMSWIRHGGVVVPREIFLEGDCFYSVTQVPVGVPLDAYVKDFSPSLTELVKLTNEVSSMLDQLHESRNPYFLGKIPPENLLISDDGVPQLIGFELNQEMKVEYRPAVDATEWSAPDAKLDARSDIFCLGKLLSKSIEMAGDQTRKAYKEEADLRALINQMVSEAPEKRVPSMSTLKTRLERLKWKDAPKPKATSVTDAPIKVHTVQEKSLWQGFVEEYRGPLLLVLLILVVSIFCLTLMFPQHD